MALPTVQSAQKTWSTVEASGIDVIGLGFGGATQSILSRVFTKYRVVGTVANLKRELYQVVRESLQA